MRRKASSLAVVLSALLVVALFAACGGSPTPKDTRTQQKKNEAEPYLDATALAKRNPADIAKELRASGRWKTVEIDKGTTLHARNSDQHYLVIIWDRKKLLLLGLTLPDRGDGTPNARLALIGVKDAPPPSRTERRKDGITWTWDRGFGPFKRAEASDRPADVEIQPKWNGGKVVVFFVPKTEYDKWVLAG